MITLRKDSRQAKFFRWCLKNPFACGTYMSSDQEVLQRDPGYYIENGTTLCHFFWACFWLPLIEVGIITGIILCVVNIHVNAYHQFGVPGLFLPSGLIIGMMLIVGAIFLAIMGADKIGLLAYLAALKQKVCPRMIFNDSTPKSET